MATMKTYVVTEPFTLSMDNGQKTLNMKKGDVFGFDGLYAEVQDQKGQARSLMKATEWYKEVDSKASKKQATLSTKAPKVEPSRTRNLTGGRIVESSDATTDPDTRTTQALTNTRTPPSNTPEPSDDLQSLVEQYEKDSQETVVSDDMADIKKEARVVNADADIVAEVSKAAKDASTSNNTSDIQMSAQESGKRPVVAMDDQVAKETDYSGEAKKPAATRKVLTVDKDAEGVVVKKTSVPTKNKSEVSTATASEKSASVVSQEEVAVSRTSSPNKHRTDVGSSTQTKKTATVAKKKAAPAASTGPRVIKAEEMEDQGAVVVGKVSKQNTVTRTQEGIISSVTVSSGGDIDAGDVTFSSSGDLEVGDVEITGEDNATVDLSGVDSDIDINDLLS